MGGTRIRSGGQGKLTLSVGILYKQLSLTHLKCHLRPGFLINFLSDGLPFDEVGVLKPPTIVGLLLISPFTGVSICPTY